MASDSGSDSDQWAEAYTASAQKGAPPDAKKKTSLRLAKSAPPQLLTGRSFLEQQCHWFDHPQLLLDAFKQDDPLHRLYQVIRWYFTALAGIHQTQGDKLRKPYNPVLGEQLHVKIELDDHRIEMLCEQVSHHPPITAFHFENQTPGLSFYGTIGDRSKLRGTYMRVKTSGSATLHLRGSLNEWYYMTYPSFDVSGLLTGKAKGTLSGMCAIQCDDTRLMAKMKFSDKNTVKIRIGTFNPDVASDPIGRWNLDVEKEMSVVSGTWNKSLSLGKGGGTFWEPPMLGTESRKYFKPSNHLGEKESWRVWEMVTLHLAMGMFEQAGQYKQQVEDAERAQAKAREVANETWTPVLFDQVTHRVRDPAGLARMCAEPVWDNATVEISLPTVTRTPPNPDDM